MNRPSEDRLQKLREFVDWCDRVTVPGVVSGRDYLQVVRELLAACDEPAAPARSEASTEPADAWDDGYRVGKADGFHDGKGWARRIGDKNPHRKAPSEPPGNTGQCTMADCILGAGHGGKCYDGY